MPAQYPGIGFPPDGPVGLARKIANNTALMAEAGGSVPFVAVPATAASAGTAGQMAYDGSYLYVATGSNQWARTPISSW